MKLKKIMCAAMAGAMALSMAATAFAADNEEDSLTQNVEVSGTTQTPTISLVVPSEGAVVLNPYKMTVAMKDGEVVDAGTTGADEKQDQIISATQYVVNKTDVPLNVGVSVTGKITSTSKVKPVFAAQSTVPATGKASLTTKSVFMYFEAMVSDDDQSEPEWAGSYDKTKANQILVSATKSANKVVETLAATNGTDAGANYLAFHFAGDMVTAPTEAWAEADQVGASIAFTFQPIANEVSD